MRKLIVSLVVAGSALAFASPAFAQYYPQPGYGYGYGYGYGANPNWEYVRGLERRIQNALGSINSVPYDRQYRLRNEAISLDRQLRYSARNGLSPYEADVIGTRVQRLEIAVQRALGRGGYGYGRYDGYNGYYGDRDRHGRGGWDRDDDDHDD